MEIKTLEKKGYKLHLLKNNNFKTISFKIVFWNELKKEDLAYRNMLVNNLLFSSFKYNTNRKIAIRKEELYSADIYGKTYRKGTQIVTEMCLSSIEDKYTEKGNFRESLEFLFDCINNPNIIDGAFDETSFNITKENIINSIKSEKENPSYEAYQKYKELIGKDKVFVGSILGTLEEVQAITPSSLYNYYQSFFDNNHIDIYILGNINEKDILDIDGYLRFNSNYTNYTNKNTYLSYEKEYSEKEENSKFNQSKLFMGGSLKNLTEHEKKYESIIYNIILGNSPTSKLFQNIREKMSYAYTISSSINRLDGMFVISAGISSKNFENTKHEVINQINEMKQGLFNNKDISDAKEVILSIIEEINDNPWAIIDHYNNFLYFDADTIEKQKSEISKIKKDDIINVANKINIDTVLLLKEDEYEEISN